MGFLYIQFVLKPKPLFKEGFDGQYLNILKQHKEEGHFPFRYLCDEKQNIIPIVLVSAFFRDDKERTMAKEYKENGVKLVGITAYKSFPKPITDASGDSDTINDTFDYFSEIQNWLCCFNDPSFYGFDPDWHRLANISESDFYDVEPPVEQEKKYDFVYVCLKDDDHCSLDGWNAINRNFKLAMNCFPIMMDELGFKVLVIGRVNCGLEKLYGEKITIMDFLPYHDFQDVLRQCRYLFVPNVYDASPRVISEALIKGIPVLMNRGILCGSKYITSETGELFTDENDLRLAIENLTINKKDPQKWWSEHYSKKKSGKRMRDILHDWYPDSLQNVQEVYF
jgi:glycosyltransferase involved in cell wall biosynthesis